MSAFILPTAVAICGFLLQNNYQQITTQLTRIEQRQTADMVKVAELQLRILQLEKQLSPTRSGLQPQPLSKEPQARM